LAYQQYIRGWGGGIITMAERVIKSVKILVNGIQVDARANQVTLDHKAEIQDTTVFNSSGRKRRAGLLDTSLSAGGFVDNGTTGLDKALYGNLAVSDSVLTVVADGTSPRCRTFFTRGVSAEYGVSGNVGEMAAFSLAANGGQALVRGKVLRCGAMTTSPQYSTAVNISYNGSTILRTSTQGVFAALHIFKVSSSGAQLKAKVQSSCSSGFTAATTALKFTSVDDSSGLKPRTAQWATTAPSTKRAWFRVSSSKVGGATPGITGYVVIGVR